MSEYRSYLITLFDESNNRLIKCALKTKSEITIFNKERLCREELPLHVSNIGKIVEIEEIFEIEIKED